MFGRKPVLPIELDDNDVINIQNTSVNTVVEAIGKINEERMKVVKENIKKAQLKQKEQYDKKHANPATFKVEMPMSIIITKQAVYIEGLYTKEKERWETRQQMAWSIRGHYFTRQRIKAYRFYLYICFIMFL